MKSLLPLFLATTTLSPEVKDARQTEYPADPLFVNRWSPRAMSGEPMSREELFTLIEAAKWAPSSFNHQPWRFIYIKNGSPEWNAVYTTLVPFNQKWAKNASYLVCIVSQDHFEHNGQPSTTAAFDTGAAWMAFALQGSMKGYVVHGMSGFDYDKARMALKVPKGYTIQAMAAVGKKGEKNSLPSDLRASETPSNRKKVSEIAFEGAFKG